MINKKEAGEKEKTRSNLKVIYISSYFPRKCGIGTFTKDLTDAVNELNLGATAEIVAVTDVDGDYDYSSEVKFEISQNQFSDYVAAANYINNSNADVVNLQHEFGLFGGNDGDYILQLVELVNKPILVCFHSILLNPSQNKKRIMKRIIEKSQVVVAMSSDSMKLLVEVYGCDRDKAVLIHHGVPKIEFPQNTQLAKDKLGIKANKMVMVSGLIGPGKGFEYVIESMAGVVKIYPDTDLYVVGQTHPGVQRYSQETYRNSLISLIHKHELESNVKQINRFLQLSELMEYYLAADIYVTPHLDPQQPSSGTLAKALGTGKACISTPFLYAREMLANSTGILVPFANATAITDAINSLIADRNLMNNYRKSAYQQGLQMQWPRVAELYLNYFRQISKQ